MKIAKFLAAYIATFLATQLMLGLSEANAQSGPAFVCDEKIYQVQSGQLRVFDPNTASSKELGLRRLIRFSLQILQTLLTPTWTGPAKPSALVKQPL